MIVPNMLTTLSAIFPVALLLLGVLGSPSAASAQAACARSCRSEVKLCAKGTREAFRGCRESCKQTRSGRGCLLSCKDAMLVARDDCSSAIATCTEGCALQVDPGSSGSSDEAICKNSCDQEFVSCLSDGIDFSRVCGRVCIADRRDDFASCPSAPNPFSCFLDAGLTAALCLGDCGSQIREWPGACRTERARCVADCEGPPPPYGSASNAFVEACRDLLE